MVSETQINNDSNDTSIVSPESSGDELIGSYLNADDLLNQPLPGLLRGEHGIETITNAPRIFHNYEGELAPWKDFKESVMAFYKDPRTKAELDRYAKVPIYMGKAIEEVNSEAMTRETIQCGAEISLSGRLFSRVLAAVISVVRTLVVPAHGKSANPTLLPQKLAFGDAKILDKHLRVDGMEPDILLKLPIQGRDQIRLVGEIKFHPLVNLERMMQGIIDGDSTEFRAILGQPVNYMLGHKLKYGFITTYDQIIFLQLDQRDGGEGDPCIYFSDVIRYDDVSHDPNDKVSDNSNDNVSHDASSDDSDDSDDTSNDVGAVTKISVSVRLAIRYLIHKTCSPEPEAANWSIPDDLKPMDLKERWIFPMSVNNCTLCTLLVNRTRPSEDSMIADITEGVSSLCLHTPEKGNSSFYAPPQQSITIQQSTTMGKRQPIQGTHRKQNTGALSTSAPNSPPVQVVEHTVVKFIEWMLSYGQADHDPGWVWNFWRLQTAFSQAFGW
ncbi:hypothetical protein PtrSN002B_005484 [Pyrenophora tritici-repentis]|uniref:Uncharacterized protein n=1 Tax=Pyrenophora tritici-repentis TaxID=45151 RepID=A0A2W1CWP9_9PLEO|nr:hypothetical protein A1F99_083990 [Pyrenophora tritici-repentis]KAI0571037.1 hypothetical protein Alg130_11021 [Pyrenophora tritici-repentis]KAI0585840.1 hypothetical protein Alg215_02343 [Pyrenophora tritici-repentis]KAI0604805.1 hypothetical protein TUN205_10950 [Pyrenophora tritici-repentis]KAI0619428.1 hypothetical protein TUN199_08573 [Pyrenophora tritici-repentis]